MHCCFTHPASTVTLTRRPALRGRPGAALREQLRPTCQRLSRGRRAERRRQGRAGLVRAADATGEVPGGEPGDTAQQQQQEEEEEPQEGEEEEEDDDDDLTEEQLDDVLSGGYAPDVLNLPPDDGVIVNDMPTVLDHRAIARLMGLGTWRLATSVGPILQTLGAHIECNWRHNIPDLGLYNLPEEYKYMDSMDPEGLRTDKAYEKIPDPQRGEPGYPRLRMESRVYQSRVFRKLHLELVRRQDGLEVLHCVMYPRVEFDLPILSLDVVGVHNRLSLAITDPCPVALNRGLPPLVAQGVRMLQERHGLTSNREVPEWGSAIFSDLCILMRPETVQDRTSYLYYTDELVTLYLTLAAQMTPVEYNRESRLKDIRAAHARYAEKQLENQKTSRVLVDAFGEERANAYMREVMFDVEREEDPGFWDDSRGFWVGQGGLWELMQQKEAMEAGLYTGEGGNGNGGDGNGGGGETPEGAFINREAAAAAAAARDAEAAAAAEEERREREP